MSSGEAGREFDPAWWSAPLEGEEDVDGLDNPLLMSGRFEAALQNPNLGDTQRDVLVALATVTSALLDPDNWQEPFTPAIQIAGRRSAVPSDLDAGQLAMVARLAPLIEQPMLRARVADVAWFYGDRSKVELIDIAIDAYRSWPLDPRGWERHGRESWARAFQLAKRRGPQGKAIIEEMCKKLQDRVLDGKSADGHMVVSLSDLLASNCRLSRDSALQIARKLASLAQEVSNADLRLSRHYEREATGWFRRAGDAAAVNDCIARVAESYASEAQLHLAPDVSNSQAAGLALEKALATIRELPTAYRREHDLDSRFKELQAQLSATRMTTLEAMIHFESDPIDLTDQVSAARRNVSGKEQFEALVRFASYGALTDPERARKNAEERLSGSLRHLFSRTTYASDGCKVAAYGGSVEDVENQIWSEVIREFDIRVHCMSLGVIIPSQEVLTLEHHFTFDYFVQLCFESPGVPATHEGLWARGLWHGLNGDYASAAALLVPQVEHLVRYHLNRHGTSTRLVDDETGVENEKSLNALLDMPEAVEILGDGVALELRALLVEKQSANLRNEIAHELLTDAAAWSHATVYAWWLCLRLMVVPLWLMQGRQAQ
ncbi:DUF4209 domain-containing protein [Actinomadura sp. 7K534]|uniref:DUF4209 domain-containing protein n=1 Tax=Actinomadura sp. 7K534 TaxID=2530366 RepID=UPI00104BBC66|nr:DUF4209 domain-containing protein [Actinomadura sp. 7K534]TDB86172.1 DUF4209 domain-containing protein [Actinomadura sp. 7K534]